MDLATLGEAERFVVGKLIEVGRIFQDLHEETRHKDALRTRARLEKQQGDAYQLYRLFAGPIATTLDNQRLPFVPVDGEVPGRNLYPWGATREELNAFIAAHPGLGAELTDPLTVVRRSDKASLQRDRQALLTPRWGTDTGPGLSPAGPSRSSPPGPARPPAPPAGPARPLP
ncbi:MAG: hypothetical protein M3Y59_02180 [Myxococcota bacterium]|nr:hypothetical protein [Myxococcota bacterium]